MLIELILLLLTLVLTRTLWKRWKYDLHKIPSPSGLPFIGHTLNVLGNRGESMLQRFAATSWRALGQPPLFKLHFGGRVVLFLRDIESVKDMLSSRTIPATKTAVSSHLVTPLMGNDFTAKKLFTTLDVTPRVKAVRRVYMNGLQSQPLKAALPQLHGVLDRMLEIIEAKRQEGPVDFQELCVRMSLDAIGVVALDANLGGLDDSRPIYKLVIEVGHIAERRVVSLPHILSHKFLPFLESNRKKQATIDALTAEWKKLADEILARCDPPAGASPMWDKLRKFEDPETGRGIEYKSLVGEIASAVVGGMDITGHQVSSVLALLMSYPPVVEKVIAELREHDLFDPGCRSVTLEDLGGLVYLSAVVKEAIRISHVANSAFDRELSADATILGYRIPKGTIVALCCARSMNSETEWEDPDSFKPERWLTGEDMSQKYYLPFGYGPRDCAGQKLALLEMRVVIIRLLQRYELKPVRTVEELLLDCRLGVVIEAAEGIWIHVKPRSS